MEWKNALDECCAEELKEMIIDNIRAGFLSDHEILDECEEYVEDNYPDDCGNITADEFMKIIQLFRDEHQNTGDQKNFLKLDSVFLNLKRQGIVALHCAGFTQSDGFDDCNEIASEEYKNGEKIIGCCFYTMQDLAHILHKESTSLYFSFGNYFDKPAAEEVGQKIAEELREAGFSVKWDKTADTKIAIEDFIWDKCYYGGDKDEYLFRADF